MSSIVQQHIQCPSCPSSDGYATYDDGHGYCFSCKYLYLPNRISNFMAEETYTYEYIEHRGLFRNTLEFYDIRTKINAEGCPVSVGFKYPNGSYKVRDLSAKQFRWDGGSSPGLYGRDRFSAGSHKFVTITEGEYDAASLWQVIGSPVVSVRSSSSAVADVSAERSWLCSFDKIVLAFDGDLPGREATAAVAKLFPHDKILVVKFDKRKDANEYLQNNEADELRTIWKNAKPYLPDNIISSFADFKRILEDTPQRGVAYPFASLNEKTDGIRRGESVLITAQEGVGKTELMHAVLHKLLKETKDGIAGYFLEEPQGHLLRSLAAIELRRPVHLASGGTSSETEGETREVLGTIETLCGIDNRLYLYTNFGSTDPDNIVDSIRFLVAGRNVSYVCLDHLSMVVSGLSAEDERRQLDYLSTKLEMLVKELNFGLIFVSHVNDNGQTRGSRYISKVADIRIDATRDLLNVDERVRNTVNLVISKNRYSGKTGFAGSYVFDQYTRQYSMLEAANDNGTEHMEQAA